MKIVVSLLCLVFSLQVQASFPFPWNGLKPIQNPLPALGIDTHSVTVSGLSSGAFMAVQLGVAYSDEISGVSAIAGGIYNCALGDSKNATDLCMKTPDKIEVSVYVKEVQSSFKKGLISDPSNIEKQKVFILNGSADNTVLPAAGEKLKQFYQAFLAHPKTDFELEMGHGFPSQKGLNACDKSQYPWVNRCSYDGAEKILTTMYGPLSPPSSKGLGSSGLNGELVTFDQQEFKSAEAKMLDYGHLYIPKECKAENAHCKLHIALHGCMQGPNLVQNHFVEGANYNTYADTNKIVVLYPAVSAGPGNLAGCWDWFGYTNGNYATKKSLQMTAIINMVHRLSAKAD